ncbi:uncharacterized protein [Antennarius striatus]|uniref:uncharacterized protein n=1 Tax=Antennarius striatus TaxID=241820 RepID=UPI0035B44FD4
MFPGDKPLDPSCCSDSRGVSSPSAIVLVHFCALRGTEGNLTPKQVVLRYKLNFHSCDEVDTWRCFTGACGFQRSLTLNVISRESSGDWCQKEGIMVRQIPRNFSFQLMLRGGNWLNGNINGVKVWRAVNLVDLRTRSDTGRANSSPQTTILPVIRVPSNCHRDLNLLAFDPDGDEVKCRYANATLLECDDCTLPSAFSLSSSCVLSFTPTNNSAIGPYVIQLMMEDFPRQNILMTQNSEQELKTTHTPISKVPVQFIYRVDLAAPRCTEGLYLPKFEPPTPLNGAQLNIEVNEQLAISIKFVVLMSTGQDLQFSGPHNMNRGKVRFGEYTLRWTPSIDEAGQSHPVCFLAQSNTRYHSEVRCVIVRVGNASITSTIQPTTPLNTTSATDTTISETTTSSTTPDDGTQTPTTAGSNQVVIGLKAMISILRPLSEDIISALLQKIKDELARRGIPTDSSLTVSQQCSTDNCS